MIFAVREIQGVAHVGVQLPVENTPFAEFAFFIPAQVAAEHQQTRQIAEFMRDRGDV